MDYIAAWKYHVVWIAYRELACSCSFGTQTASIELLEKRVEQGTAIIFVTHDLMLAVCAERRIMMMKNGKLC